MGKKILLGALENLEGEPEEPIEMTPEEETAADQEVEAAMVALMEDEEAIDQIDEDDARTEDKIDELESATERLEALRDTILKHGICAGMMEAVDPGRELVAAKICKAYEELEALPVKDEESTAVAEGLGDAIAKSVTGYIDFYIKQFKASIEYYVAIGRAFKSQEAALGAANQRLQGVAVIDENKFASKSVKAYRKGDFTKVAEASRKVLKVVNGGSLNTVLADFEKFIANGKVSTEQVESTYDKAITAIKSLEGDDINAAVGINVSTKEGKIVVGRAKARFERSKGNCGEFGWKGGDAKVAVRAAMEITRSADVMVTKLKATNDIIKSYAGALKQQVKRSGEFSAEEKAAFKNAVAKSKEIIGLIRSLTSCVEGSSRGICNTAIALSKAAVASK